ncbi:MAG: YceI family protein [Sterolibacteriaceae bacterium]|nr:YceI family protein [Sterolibacteriaceae bacterium]MBK9086777.1 YceI family protein [Sterolibacteriaceae bacterium]
MIRTTAVALASLIFAGAIASGTASAAEVGPVQIDQSRVAFVSKQMGVPIDGEFRKFSARLSFDPAKPEAGRARIDIDMASIDAGSAEANEEVVGKNWFNVRQFPTAGFVSTGVRPLGGGKFEVAGTLTIRDKTREVLAPFTMTAQAATVQFDGSFVINRADFGIGRGVWADFDTVANEVQIKFKLVAAAKK